MQSQPGPCHFFSLGSNPEGLQVVCVCVRERERERERERLSHVRFFEIPWTVAPQAPLSMGFSRKNTGMDCHFLLQGIFPTQGSNQCLLHWQTLDCLSHQGSPGLQAMDRERWADKASLSQPVVFPRIKAPDGSYLRWVSWLGVTPQTPVAGFPVVLRNAGGQALEPGRREHCLQMRAC